MSKKFGTGWHKLTQIQQSWIAPAAPSTSGGADQFDFGTAVPANLANLVQPDYPRNIYYNLTGTFTSVAITVTGVDAQGNPATESKTLTADAVGDVAFATVSQIRITAQTGGPGGNCSTSAMGRSSACATPLPQAPRFTRSSKTG